jgi:hypothetical protein
MTQTVFRVAAAAFLVLSMSPAYAQSGSARYRFTTLLDSQSGLFPDSCPAINTLGTVAVLVREEDPFSGPQVLITKRGANDSPVVIASTEEVANFPTFCDNGFNQITSDPSINDLGEVAFQGNLDDLSTNPACDAPEQTNGQRQGVFLGRGGRLTTIAHTTNGTGRFISEFLVADGSVNNFGQVALSVELEDPPLEGALLVGSRTGRFVERFRDSTSEFDTPSARMSLNEWGQVAFEDNGIVVSNPNGTFTRIVDSNFGSFAVFDPSLNNLGRVAFTGFRFVGGEQVQGMFTGGGGPVTTVADSSGPFSSFSEPSLNDLNRIVFTAELDEAGPNGFPLGGVFTGSDPVADRVLGSGDTYEGVPVSSVFTCHESLNNRGQIAMIVISEDPNTFEQRRFVVRATPRRPR